MQTTPPDSSPADASPAHLEFGPWHAVSQPFEADFFGGPVWRLVLTTPDDPAEAEGLAAAQAHARATGVRLISCRLPPQPVDAGDPPRAEPLKQAGFRLIERLITLTCPLADTPLPLPEGVRTAEDIDMRPLVQLGRSAFVHDRLHADPLVMDPIADGIKGAWVQNGLNGRADAALVVDLEDRPAGFNLVILRGDQAFIDLIAVAGWARRQGLGTTLIKASLAWGAGRARVMHVGTQDTNAPSLALYHQCGFTPEAVAPTFHWMP